MTTIKPDTFLFLSELSANNNREWFNNHKVWYEQSKNNVIDFANYIYKELSTIDPYIKPNDGKDAVFRIYRDIRFSKDKTPYKTNFGIGFSQKGKSVSWPGFYIQIEPNNSFIAGGYWLPEKDHLNLIRQEIDYEGESINHIFSSSEFKKYFSEFDQEYQLKKAPKSYPENHININLLKLKSFTVSHNFQDDILMNSDGIIDITNGLKHIQSLNQFLINAITIS